MCEEHKWSRRSVHEQGYKQIGKGARRSRVRISLLGVFEAIVRRITSANISEAGKVAVVYDVSDTYAPSSE